MFRRCGVARGLVLAALLQSLLALPQTGAAAEEFGGSVAFNIKDATPAWPKPVTAPGGAPNIVVIILDDVGFGTTSTFGGPARTPALDRLASEGLRFNNFHTTALCSPTRAALLTGRNAHRVGFGSVMESASGFPGYNGLWRKDAVSVAEVLRRAGYSTGAFGKWHNTPYREVSPVGPFDRWPTSLGFEHFYGFMVGATSQWEPPLFRNTFAVEPPATAAQGYHVTTDIVDEAIGWLQTHESLAGDKPYFLYLATGATHSPHHVPQSWIDQYRGRFDQGWDALRKEIFERQKRLGVIPRGTVLTGRPDELPAWGSLTKQEQKLYARQMEVYSAFMSHTDHEVGRLLDWIRESAGGKNTLVLYIVGDNGESAEGGLEGRDVPFADVATRLEHAAELGGPRWYNRTAAGFAWAASSPFKWMKQVASHFGATRNPLVVSWPARIGERGGLRTNFAHVVDVAATLYEVAGVPFPTVVDGVEQLTLDGVSFASEFTRAKLPAKTRVQYFEMMGNRAIYQDGWLAAARHSHPWQFPRSENFDGDVWELYHVAEDFSQAHDLAARYPQKLQALEALFEQEAQRNNVYPLNNAFGSAEFGAGQPSIIAGRKQFVYYAGMPRLSNAIGGLVPDFQHAHRISARVNIPEGGAQGVVFSSGWRGGGFVLFVKDGRFVYEHNSLGEIVATLRSEPLPRGSMELAFEYVPDDEAQRRERLGGWSDQWPSGTGRLYVDGRLVDERRIEQFAPTVSYMGTLNVGIARGSPVSQSYEAPFKFSGKIERVLVRLQ